MAYGLRLINNNKLAWGNGRDSHALGDPSFVHGKASHGVAVKGRAPSEVLMGKRLQQLRLQEAAASGASPASASRPSGGLAPAVLRRWRSAHEAPSAGFVMGQRAPPRPDLKESGPAALASSQLPADFPTDEEVLPKKFRLETFPVGKHRTHSERSMRRLAPDDPFERPTWLLEPRGPALADGGAAPHYWFSERKVHHVMEHHRAAKQGHSASWSAMPLAQSA